MTALLERLEGEPDYRPYCLNCSTMQRMTLHVRDGRQIMRCEIAPETHLGATMMLEKFGIPPRVGCGLEFDVATGKREAALDLGTNIQRAETAPCRSAGRHDARRGRQDRLSVSPALQSTDAGQLPHDLQSPARQWLQEMPRDLSEAIIMTTPPPNTQITPETVTCECVYCADIGAPELCRGYNRPAASSPSAVGVGEVETFAGTLALQNPRTPTPAPSADHIGDATEMIDWERVGPKLVEAINGEINWLKAVVSVCSDSGVVIGAKHSLRQMRKAAALAAATPGGK